MPPKMLATQELTGWLPLLPTHPPPFPEGLSWMGGSPGEIELLSQRIPCLVLGQKVPLKYSGEIWQASAVDSRGERPVQAGERGLLLSPQGSQIQVHLELSSECLAQDVVILPQQQGDRALKNVFCMWLTNVTQFWLDFSGWSPILPRGS